MNSSQNHYFNPITGPTDSQIFLRISLEYIKNRTRFGLVQRTDRSLSFANANAPIDIEVITV